MKSAIISLAMVIVAAVSVSASAATWNRAADWTGSGANPDGAWSYQSIQVEDANGDVTPWYEGTMVASTWRAPETMYVNTSPATHVSWTWIAQSRQDRLQSNWNTHATYIPHWVVPAVQWTNTTGDTIEQLDIDGTATLVWTNETGTNGYNGSTLEAMIFRLDADGTTYTPLQDLTSVKPTPGWTVDTLPITVDLSVADMDPGDSIVIALKGLDDQVDYRGQLIDDLTITAIPEPLSMALLSMGSLVMLKRRH